MSTENVYIQLKIRETFLVIPLVNILAFLAEKNNMECLFSCNKAKPFYLVKSKEYRLIPSSSQRMVQCVSN